MMAQAIPPILFGERHGRHFRGAALHQSTEPGTLLRSVLARVADIRLAPIRIEAARPASLIDVNWDAGADPDRADLHVTIDRQLSGGSLSSGGG